MITLNSLIEGLQKIKEVDPNNADADLAFILCQKDNKESPVLYDNVSVCAPLIVLDRLPNKKLALYILGDKK